MNEEVWRLVQVCHYQHTCRYAHMYTGDRSRRFARRLAQVIGRTELFETYTDQQIVRKGYTQLRTFTNPWENF